MIIFFSLATAAVAWFAGWVIKKQYPKAKPEFYAVLGIGIVALIIAAFAWWVEL